MAKTQKNHARKPVAQIIDPQAADIEKAKADKTARLRNARILKASEAPTEAESTQAPEIAETSETPATQAPEAEAETQLPETEMPEASEDSEAPSFAEQIKAIEDEKKLEKAEQKAGKIADLNAALSAIVAKAVTPAMTEAQKTELLAADADLKAVVEAFNALNDKQKDNFAEITGFKTKRATSTGKAAEKKAKAEVAPEIKALACEVFTVESPSIEQYQQLAQAQTGVVPEPIDWTAIPPVGYAAKDRYYDETRAKDKRTNARVYPAVRDRDLVSLQAAIDFINEKGAAKTYRRIIKAYGRLAQIAFAAQDAKAEAEDNAEAPEVQAEAQA